MKFIHTCYRVRNLEISIKFYEELFGFEVVRRNDFPEYEFTLVYMIIPGSAHELELTYNYNHEAYDIGNGYGHIAVATPDLEALHQKHKEDGYDVTDLKGLPGRDAGFYFVTDPDGYKIEVVRDGFIK